VTLAEQYQHLYMSNEERRKTSDSLQQVFSMIEGRMYTSAQKYMDCGAVIE